MLVLVEGRGTCRRRVLLGLDKMDRTRSTSLESINAHHTPVYGNEWKQLSLWPLD